MVEDVGHLVGHRVLIAGHGNAADALHRGKRGVEARAVVADDGYGVAALEPQLAQADGKSAHLSAQFVPCPRLPDPQVLAAHGRTRAKLRRVAQEQLRDGIEARGALAAHGVYSSLRRW